MSPAQDLTHVTFLKQEGYIPILFDGFLMARKAEGLSQSTMRYYRRSLSVFVAFYEAQQVTQIQDVTPDLLRASC